MQQSEEIRILFQRMIGKPEPIRLINTYKALPIAYPAVLLGMKSNAIHVRTDQLQILCMGRDNYTYVQGKSFPTAIKANVTDIDFIQNQAELENFSYETGSIGKRTQVRVEPRETTIGLLYTTDENKTDLCEIADLSLDGLGLYLMETIYTPVHYPIGALLTVHFRLPIETDSSIQELIESIPYSPPLEKDYRLFRFLYIPAPLMKYPSIWGKVAIPREIYSKACTMQGVIVNTSAEPVNRRVRLGIRVIPDNASRLIVSKYIVQRQTEIIHEIRSKYEVVHWLLSNEQLSYNQPIIREGEIYAIQ